MTNEVSIKSTKAELLDAYNEALAKIKELKAVDRKIEKKKEEEEKVIKSASQYSPEKIVKELGETKLEIVRTIDNINDKVNEEYKKLTDTMQAIEIEKKYLEEILEIKECAESLSALIQAQKEKKAAFEEDMDEKKKSFDEEMFLKRNQWKLEQDNYEFQKKERDTQLKKDRQREEEEYTYNLKLQRKKDADQYEANKQKLEKELADKKAAVENELDEREALIAAKEKEFEELKSKVESFAAELDMAVKETEKSVMEKIEYRYKHQAELAAKEIDGERKLNKQMVASLESKIKEQDELIRQLTQRTTEAGLQVQSIAIKAIEGASSQRVFTSMHEKGSEVAKG